jgi:aspartate dehydrogenase
MAETLLSALAEGLAAPLERLSILSTGSERAAALLERFGNQVARTHGLYRTLPEMLEARPEVVAECAGHGAVRAHGAAVLTAGCDLVVISVGALADDALRGELERAAAQGGSRLSLPAGAVGGIDALAAARLSGLEEVTYSGRKPPRAWIGTPAERQVDLGTITEPAVFFEGTAREAARLYPQNANVAATIALAGLGFDGTRVRLIADPTISRNLHEVSVRSAALDFQLRLEGRPSPVNPKTSLTAGYSLARDILNRVALYAI